MSAKFTELNLLLECYVTARYNKDMNRGLSKSSVNLGC